MIDWWLLACVFAAFMAVRSLVQLGVQYYRVQYHFELAKKMAELGTQIEQLKLEQAKSKIAELTAIAENKNQEPAKTPAKPVPTAKRAA